MHKVATYLNETPKIDKDRVRKLFEEIASPDNGFQIHASKDMINKLQKIVNTKQSAKINGHIIDLMTASVVMSIYNALGPDAQEQMEDFDILKVVSISWKIFKKSNGTLKFNS